MNPRVIVALDFSSADEANQLVDRLSPELCRLKVGNQLFTTAGPDFVESLVRRNYAVFLDLKFHDIPETVAKACRAAARLGVWMINVHALGGQKMLEAARNALSEFDRPPKLIGVTLLTSLKQVDIQALGFSNALPDTVLHLARLSQHCQLDGVVCSAHEAAMLRENLGPDFLLVTPGIRLGNEQKDDQQRVMTPREARLAGSDFLVVGRPITGNADPVEVLKEINRQILL